MSTNNFTNILAITILSFSTGVMAEDMSQSEYKAAEKRIVADYNSKQKYCDLFASKDKNICMTEAKRTQKIARAALVERYRPHTKATSAMRSRLNRDRASPRKAVS